MTIVGSYRYSSAASGSTISNRIINIGGFKISGLVNTAALAVCQYVWNPATSQWEPMTQP